MSRASRQFTFRSFAAAPASRARSSAVPRVPSSPLVRSRMPVECPKPAILSRVPPQVCSTSSRCAAIARMSTLMTNTYDRGAEEQRCTEKSFLSLHQICGERFQCRGAIPEAFEGGIALGDECVSLLQRLVDTKERRIGGLLGRGVFTSGLA